MKNLLKKTFIPIITIGTLITAVWLFQGVENWSVITRQSIQLGTYNWEFYSFDIRRYLGNLETSVNPKQLELLLPEFPMIPLTPDWTDILSVLKFIANNLIFSPNMLIYIVNLTILAPTKLLMYPINIMITLLGFNSANIDWVIIVRNIMKATIDYIPYL